VPLIEHVQKEWAALKGAPISFAILLVLGLSTGIGIASWHYSERMELKESQISRYRVALGIDASSKGALIELNNWELQAKTANTVAKLRNLCRVFDKRGSAINAEATSGKLSKKEQAERMQALMKEVSDEYHRDLRSDFLNVNNELLRRLDPKVSASVVRGPTISDADTGTLLGLPSVVPSGMGLDMIFICDYADQIEQLAKLLPVSNSVK
jgi:hypothetical protein